MLLLLPPDTLAFPPAPAACGKTMRERRSVDLTEKSLMGGWVEREVSLTGEGARLRARTPLEGEDTLPATGTLSDDRARAWGSLAWPGAAGAGPASWGPGGLGGASERPGQHWVLAGMNWADILISETVLNIARQTE